MAHDEYHGQLGWILTLNFQINFPEKGFFDPQKGFQGRKLAFLWVFCNDDGMLTWSDPVLLSVPVLSKKLSMNYQPKARTLRRDRV